jgi:5-methylcytosine-specific restriction endonuclease McrBC GTP-binding regulatory subunit McrB
MQQILFGAPDTGKSFKIDDPEKGYGLKDVDESRKFRTTFHPDYDYAQFVGAYKPKKEGDAITYSFVPQVFAKAYATAWKQYFAAGNASTAENQVYLVIEEINRGNCAQIFGDIFQLLDRDADGSSQYSIDADCDFAEWLEKEFKTANVWDTYVGAVGDGKLKLPPNLNILATMNTSDQSLFPMDSAFKRRFDWEYVPINYEKSEADFIVGDASFNFKWLDFLKKVNADIYKVTQSEDKQMGEFFIKPKNKDYITLDEFRSKVLFYLWDSVYKDELDSKLVFHFAYPEKGPDVTFQRLFNSDFVEILQKMLANLDDKYKDGAQQE